MGDVQVVNLVKQVAYCHATPPPPPLPPTLVLYAITVQTGIVQVLYELKPFR